MASYLGTTAKDCGISPYDAAVYLKEVGFKNISEDPNFEITEDMVLLIQYRFSTCPIVRPNAQRKLKGREILLGYEDVDKSFYDHFGLEPPCDKIPLFLKIGESSWQYYRGNRDPHPRRTAWKKIVHAYEYNDTVPAVIEGSTISGFNVYVFFKSAFLPDEEFCVPEGESKYDYIHKSIDVKIIGIDQTRMKVTVSNRQLYYESNAEDKMARRFLPDED